MQVSKPIMLAVIICCRGQIQRSVTPLGEKQTRFQNLGLNVSYSALRYLELNIGRGTIARATRSEESKKYLKYMTGMFCTCDTKPPTKTTGISFPKQLSDGI